MSNYRNEQGCAWCHGGHQATTINTGGHLGLNARKLHVFDLGSTDHAALASVMHYPFQEASAPRKEEMTLATRGKSSCEELARDRAVYPIKSLRWSSAIAGSAVMLATVVARFGFGSWLKHGTA
jgi:hypothetical protein